MHAQRLLVERGKTDVVPALIERLRDRSVDAIGLNVGAIHAMWTMHGLGALDGSNAAGDRGGRGGAGAPVGGRPAECPAGPAAGRPIGRRGAGRRDCWTTPTRRFAWRRCSRWPISRRRTRRPGRWPSPCGADWHATINGWPMRRRPPRRTTTWRSSRRWPRRPAASRAGPGPAPRCCGSSSAWPSTGRAAARSTRSAPCWPRSAAGMPPSTKPCSGAWPAAGPRAGPPSSIERPPSRSSSSRSGCPPAHAVSSSGW